MIQPNFAQIYHGIFPDALEVKEVKDKDDFVQDYIVIFDPQNCIMTPESWDLISKLGHKIVKMEFNIKTNQMEVYIQ